MLLLGRGSAPRSTSTRSPGEVAANGTMRPPARVASTAWSNGAWPVRRQERTSAPRPSVSARTSAARRATRRAPRTRRARRQLQPVGEAVRPTTAAPFHRQSCISIEPIGPWPTTRTVSPFATPRLLDRLQAGVHGLDERGLLGQHAVGHPDRAALHDPRQRLARIRRSRRPTARSRPWSRSACRSRTARRRRRGSRSRRGRGCGGAPRRRRPRGTRHARADAGHAARDLVAEDPRRRAAGPSRSS